MNKKVITIALAAFFAVFTTSSCSDKGSNSNGQETVFEEEDDDETYDRNQVDDEDKDDREPVKEYLSQDLATFDLYGQVLSVSYDKGEHVLCPSIQFEPSGSVVAILRADAEGTAENAVIERDDDDRIVLYYFESDSPWVTMFEYEGDGTVPPVSRTYSNQMGNWTTETYHRDASGTITSVDFEEAVHGGIVEDPDGHVYTYSDFDRHGNWLTSTDRNGEYTFVTKRTISYHSK